jgi:hypothetical protein
MKKILFTLIFGLSIFSNVYSENNNVNSNEITDEFIELRDKCDIIYENVYNDIYNHGGTDQEAKAIAAAAKCACKEVLTQAPK